MKEFTAIILADSVSMQMNSKKPDAIQKICGKPLAYYVINAAKAAGAEKVITVTGEYGDVVRDALGEMTEYAESASVINDLENCVVLNGNAPFTAIRRNPGNTVSLCDDFKITNRIQLSESEEMMQKHINGMHMRNGVTIHAPSTVFIDADVQIGADTEIFGNVIIEKGSLIGSDVVITSGSRISNSEIGDGVNIQTSVILDSEIRENTTVGPFAYVRPNCVVGSNARIGDFVELKNTNIGNGTKVSHLTYVGDSDVGENCNFGCGTVTVNYDGKKKYRTTIGNNVFVGCNSNLVAPVTLKDGAYTAAGSTITDEVPENNLAIARARQVNKETWKDRRTK